VALLVYRALRAHGVRAALYTSPHLVDARERMVVDDRPITPEAFAQWTEVLQEDVEATEASFFEATTAIAFADFAARGAEVAVVEVGLGGRLDSTNVLAPLVSAVTHVTRDHADFLGDSLHGIAAEKAGIAKPDTPFVVGETDPALRDVLAQHAAAAGARVVIVPPGAQYEGPLGLTGGHQRRNAAVAQAVLHELPPPLRPDDEGVRRGFAAAHLPGRFERRGKWILDVAHNPAGTAVLAATVRELAPPRPRHALVGIMRDKDWAAMLAQLEGVVDAVWATIPPTAPVERCWDLEPVRERFPNVTAEPDFDRALAEVQQSAETVVVAGSFHTVGDAMARLPGFPPLG
jgi:dihydrofolate synthase/folylpolyglutamate synthase